MKKSSSYVGLGLVFGAVLGILLDNIGLWLALGLVFGAAYSRTHKKEDAPEE